MQVDKWNRMFEKGCEDWQTDMGYS
jgi:hypothetical protein